MKKYLSILLVLIISFIGLFIYQQFTYTYITVKFKELRPFEDKIPVYYKGIKIGKATDKKHTDDYKHTIVKIVLYPKDIHLPSNTKVLLKQIKKGHNQHDILELIYPKKPTDKLISNGSILEGKATIDLETYFRNQNIDDLDYIKENLTAASENLNYSLDGLNDLFIILQDTIKDNQGNIRATTKNIKNATGEINQSTRKINRSLKQEQLNTTMNNIDSSISNIKLITENVNDTTVSVNKTIPDINSTIKETQNIIANTNAITCGVRQTLRKRLGGFKLIFGKPLNEAECKACGD